MYKEGQIHASELSVGSSEGHERLSPQLIKQRRSSRLRICFHEDRGSGKRVERNKDDVDIL